MRSHLLFIMLAMSSFAMAQPAQPDLSYIRKDSIQIIRDEWGVPHIYAPTDAEMAYGFAWAQCEDDFPTIQEFLLITKGYSGMKEGVNGAKLDYAVGMLRSKEITMAEYDKQVSPSFQKYLRAFAAGVNRWVELHPEEVKIKKAFPVSEYDIIAAFNLGLSLMSGVQSGFTKILDNKLEPMSQLNLPKGSNAMAVHPSKTEDGKAYIAINSHQPLEGILSWYEAHLISGEGTNILGGAFPGACTMGVGVNENLAWAHTLSYPDLMDIYKLEMHPKKKGYYRFDGEWKKLESKKIPLKIKFPKSGIKLTVKKKGYWSIYGPTLETKNGFYSFRMPTFNMLGAAEQWYNMSKAGNYTEYTQALNRQSIPCFNIIYADRFDTIMYLSNVTVPLRNPEYDWKKTLPGDTSATFWEMKFHPVCDLPQVVNPKSGYVYNANNSPLLCTDVADNPVASKFDITMGTQELHTNRSARFEKLLREASTDSKITWKEFLDIKFDMKYPQPFEFPVDVSSVFEAAPSKYPAIKEELEILQSWDRSGDTTSTGASMFVMSLHFILDKIDDLNLNSNQRPVIADSIIVKSIQEGSAHLKKYFGTLHVPLGKLQRFRRANVDLPIAGLPDMVVAMYSRVNKTDGTLNPRAGETYIMMVKIGKDNRPEMYTVSPFGASARAGDPHYTDQMSLFTNHEFKQMTLDLKEIKKKAVRIYSPK